MADANDLIAAIYDTIVDPSGWDEVVKRIVEATKSVSGGISIRADAAHLTALCNVDPFYTDLYVHTYYKRNPFSAEEATIAPGEIRTGTHIIRTDNFRASAIYNEYMRPQGWADVVAVGLMRAPDAVGYLSLQRSPDAIWVEPAEWHLLKNPRAAFEKGGRGPPAPFQGQSGNGVARLGGHGRRFRRFSLERGLPGRLRQCQGRGPRAARNRLAV
jgi:hypothetical protein